MIIAEEETESAGKIDRFGQNLVSVEIPPLERTTRLSKSFAWKMLQHSKMFCEWIKLACILCLYTLQAKRPTDLDSFELPRLIEKLHIRL